MVQGILKAFINRNTEYMSRAHSIARINWFSGNAVEKELN
jgi:hypothetical protein